MIKERLAKVMSIMTGYMAERTGKKEKSSESLEEIIEGLQELTDKHYELFMLMSTWVKLKQNGKDIVGYLEQKGYKQIAIYGMGHVSGILINEIYDSDIKILYGIDKNADSIYEEFNVVKPGGKLKQVDAVIVTSITYFDEIKRDLEKKIDCPIVSLKNILYAVGQDDYDLTLAKD